MTFTQSRALSNDILQNQVHQIDLILAMYSGESHLADGDHEIYESIKRGLEEPSYKYQRPDKSFITVHISVPIDLVAKSLSLILSVEVPVLLQASHQAQDDLLPFVQLHRPDWLTRKAFNQIVGGLPGGTEDCISETIQYLQQEVPSVIDRNSEIKREVLNDSSPLARVWFYFPSLSTREKRSDLVKLAPQYELTGFVLAGKPGVLCVEGCSDSIQSYIVDIKRTSWGDIPSFQEKITERFRECEAVGRKFDSMREITDEIERHGQRGNRGNLAQVEEFLKSAGLGEAFSKIFMQCER